MIIKNQICNNKKLIIFIFLSNCSITQKFICKKLTCNIGSRWSKNILCWTININLPHMCIPPILVIAYYSYLYHKCPNRSVIYIFYRNDNPATWFIQIHDFYFLKIIKICTCSDTYSKNMITAIIKNLLFLPNKRYKFLTY